MDFRLDRPNVVLACLSGPTSGDRGIAGSVDLILEPYPDFFWRRHNDLRSSGKIPNQTAFFPELGSPQASARESAQRACLPGADSVRTGFQPCFCCVVAGPAALWRQAVRSST